jgi:hypothetical protein
LAHKAIFQRIGPSTLDLLVAQALTVDRAAWLAPIV